METRCAARRLGQDEMHCPACRITWHTDDPDPPACGRTVQAPVRQPERVPATVR